MMRLPFTHEEFLDVFASYNQLLWPAAAVLWVVTLAVMIRFWRTGSRASRMVSVLLAFHWTWSAVAYQLAFFRSVNPAAALFGVLFLVQAALFSWQGVVRGRLVFELSRSPWTNVAAFLVAYALAYPGLGLLLGLSYPRAPTFGVPCPTAILTIGMLLMLPPRQARMASVIPLIWTAIASSAAFLFAIRADFALPVAGGLLIAHLLEPGERETATRLASRLPADPTLHSS